MGTNIYTAALMAHNTHPDYKYDLENANYTQEGINPSCGDEMTLKLRVEDGVIEVMGARCRWRRQTLWPSVSQASASKWRSI